MKKVYAVSGSGGDAVTADKKYEIEEDPSLGGFMFTADDGVRAYACWENSAHIYGGNWTRVELDVPDAKVDEAHLRLQQAEDKLDRVVKALKAALEEAHR